MSLNYNLSAVARSSLSLPSFSFALAVLVALPVLSLFGVGDSAAYTAAKGGVKQLTKAMAVEWAKHNIQANGIGPGYIETEMTRPLRDREDFDAWVREKLAGNSGGGGN